MCQKRVSRPNSWAVTESDNSAKFGKYIRYQNRWRLGSHPTKWPTNPSTRLSHGESDQVFKQWSNPGYYATCGGSDLMAPWTVRNPIASYQNKKKLIARLQVFHHSHWGIISCEKIKFEKGVSFSGRFSAVHWGSCLWWWSVCALLHTRKFSFFLTFKWSRTNEVFVSHENFTCDAWHLETYGKINLEH